MTITKGYLIPNVTQKTLKRHDGSHDWQTVIGAKGGQLGFYGVTPVVQPAGADQAAVRFGNTDGEICGLSIPACTPRYRLNSLFLAAYSW